jgi:uncharacterized protein YcbX
MPTRPAEVSGLYRYPVKGLSPEPLQKVEVSIGQTFPADRRYAIENGPSGFAETPAWKPKTVFLTLTRDERIAGLQTQFEDDSQLLTIRRNGEVVARGKLDTADGRAAIESFFAANFARALKGTPKVLSSEGHSFSFSDFARKVVSIINLASLHAIETIVGNTVHPLRFRGNLYVDGWPPWQEAGLLGRTLAVGDARLKVVKNIPRCPAVNIDPETAARDLDIPASLMRRLGHTECGIYAEVIAPGSIAVGDPIEIGVPVKPTIEDVATRIDTKMCSAIRV